MPSRNNDGEWWTLLKSGVWDGVDDLQVFSEFVDIMFTILTGGHIEWEMRPLFAERHDEKVDLVYQAMVLLGDEMERHPFGDRLGDYHQELSSACHKSALGSFYTPESVCRICAEINTDEDEARAKIARGEVVTICDPASGSGRLPLAMAAKLEDVRDCIRITCTDIELLACKMAYINLAAWDVPATIIHGDSLRNQEWGVWKTPHLIRIEFMESLAAKWGCMVRLFGQPPQEFIPEASIPNVQMELNF